MAGSFLDFLLGMVGTPLQKAMDVLQVPQDALQGSQAFGRQDLGNVPLVGWAVHEPTGILSALGGVPHFAGSALTGGWDQAVHQTRQMAAQQPELYPLEHTAQALIPNFLPIAGEAFLPGTLLRGAGLGAKALGAAGAAERLAGGAPAVNRAAQTALTAGIAADMVNRGLDASPADAARNMGVATLAGLATHGRLPAAVPAGVGGAALGGMVQQAWQGDQAPATPPYGGQALGALAALLAHRPVAAALTEQSGRSRVQQAAHDARERATTAVNAGFDPTDPETQTLMTSVAGAAGTPAAGERLRAEWERRIGAEYAAARGGVSEPEAPAPVSASEPASGPPEDFAIKDPATREKWWRVYHDLAPWQEEQTRALTEQFPPGPHAVEAENALGQPVSALEQRYQSWVTPASDGARFTGPEGLAEAYRQYMPLEEAKVAELEALHGGAAVDATGTPGGAADPGGAGAGAPGADGAPVGGGGGSAGAVPALAEADRAELTGAPPLWVDDPTDPGPRPDRELPPGTVYRGGRWRAYHQPATDEQLLTELATVLLPGQEARLTARTLPTPGGQEARDVHYELWQGINRADSPQGTLFNDFLRWRQRFNAIVSGQAEGDAHEALNRMLDMLRVLDRDGAVVRPARTGRSGQGPMTYSEAQLRPVYEAWRPLSADEWAATRSAAGGGSPAVPAEPAVAPEAVGAVAAGGAVVPDVATAPEPAAAVESLQASTGASDAPADAEGVQAPLPPVGGAEAATSETVGGVPGPDVRASRQTLAGTLTGWARTARQWATAGYAPPEGVVPEGPQGMSDALFQYLGDGAGLELSQAGQRVLEAQAEAMRVRRKLAETPGTGVTETSTLRELVRAIDTSAAAAEAARTAFTKQDYGAFLKEMREWQRIAGRAPRRVDLLSADPAHLAIEAFVDKVERAKADALGVAPPGDLERRLMVVQQTLKQGMLLSPSFVEKVGIGGALKNVFFGHGAGVPGEEALAACMRTLGLREAPEIGEGFTFSESSSGLFGKVPGLREAANTVRSASTALETQLRGQVWLDQLRREIVPAVEELAKGIGARARVDAAQHGAEIDAAALAGVIEDLQRDAAGLGRGDVPGDLTGRGLHDRLRDAGLTEAGSFSLMRELDNITAEARENARHEVNRVHFDYSDRTRFEEAAGKVVPFSQYAFKNTRQVVPWLAEHPYVYGAMMSLDETNDQAQEASGASARYRGDVPVLGGPLASLLYGRPGAAYADPLQLLELQGPMRDNVYSPTQNTPLGRVYDLAQRFGVSPWVYLTGPAQVAGLLGDRRFGEVFPVDRALNKVAGVSPETPAVEALNFLQRRFAGQREEPTLTGDRTLDYLVRRRIDELAVEDTGQPAHAVPEYQAAKSDAQSRIFQEALADVRRTRAAEGVLNFVGPVSGKFRGETEARVQQAMRQDAEGPLASAYAEPRDRRERGRPRPREWRVLPGGRQD